MGRQTRGPILLARNLLLEPLLIDFLARELREKHLFRHAATANERLADHLFLFAHRIKVDADPTYDFVKVLWRQLERGKALGKRTEVFDCSIPIPAIALDVALGLLQLLSNDLEARPRLLGIRPRVGFRLLVIVAIAVIAILDLGRRGHIIGRIEITNEYVRELVVFDRLIVGVDDVLHRPGELADGCHHIAEPFLDALCNLNFSLPGEQFDRAHLPHIHADRIGGAPHLCLHRSQSSGSLFRGELICGRIPGGQQLIGIGGLFEDLDAHFRDHTNDVFDLIRIRNIRG